jgi:hypothetical protein
MSLKAGEVWVHDREMKTLMKLEELKTIGQLTEFLNGTQGVAFCVLSEKDERYRWIGGELIRWRYLSLGKRERGVVVRYLMKVSGYSRQQMTRLIAQYRERGRLERQQRTVGGFGTKYTSRDIGLLVEVDKRHETPCGQRIKKLCERASKMYGGAEYENLASISISHLYNLKKIVRLCAAAALVPKDAGEIIVDRGTAKTPSGWKAGLSAHRHGASRGLGQDEGGVPHRCD